MLMASALMLIGCEGKLEPKEVFEVKIDRKIQKLNDDEISKFQKYQASICKVSEYFSENIKTETLTNSESTVFTDKKILPQEEIVTISGVSAFNIKDFNINTKRFLLEKDILTIEDLTALDDFFMVLDKMKKDWANVDVYLSNTSSFEDLKNYKIYSFSKMSLERNKVVCERKLLKKRQQ
jgi:hypothetical protein